MDIIILSLVISILFIITSIGPILFQEYSIRKNEKQDLSFNDFLKNYFSFIKANKDLKPKEKIVIYKKMAETISDMESNGVYFSDDIKDDLKKIRKDLVCHYSGLPSAKSYDRDN
jgi:hypothetical protein